jgi:hypothetical protein
MPRWKPISWASAALSLVATCSSDHATKLATGSFPWGIAIEGADVYWVNMGEAQQGSVVKAPKSGGAPVTLASNQVNPVSIAVDAQNVYWTTSGTSTCAPSGACTSNGDGTVMSAPLTGGTPTMLAGKQLAPVSIAVDVKNVYFIDEGTAVYNSTITDGSVMKVPIGGGTPTALATGLRYPGALTVDATSVYWTVMDSQGVNGTLMKVSIDGGAATTLASGYPPWTIQTGGATIPKLIAVDSTSVYWVSGNIDAAGAKIMKIPTGGGTRRGHVRAEVVIR